MAQFRLRWLPLLISISVAGTRVCGGDFAVENRIVRDGKLVEKSTTIFVDDEIYDVLQSKEERRVSIYSIGNQRFRVLDLDRKIQMVIARQDLDKWVLGVTEKAKREKNSFVKFAASPEFTEKGSTDRIELSSKHWTYDVDFRVEKDPELARQYRLFADAFASLNTIWSPFPPNARLKLNDRLEKRNGLPQKVRISIPGDVPRHSEHTYSWDLKPEHQRLVKESKESQLRFAVVGLSEFRPAKTAAVRKKVEDR